MGIFLTVLGTASASALMAIIWGPVGFWSVWGIYCGVVAGGSIYALINSLKKAR